MQASNPERQKKKKVMKETGYSGKRLRREVKKARRQEANDKKAA